MPVRLVPLPARAEPRPAPTLTVQSWHVGATPAGTEPSPSLPLISATPVSGNDTGIRVNDRADPSCPLISATPLLREPDLTQSRLEAANSGSPDKISLSNASAESRQPGTAPMISFNLGSFQAQLASSGQDNQGETGTTTPARLLSMSMPRSQAMPFVPRSLFRLWTLRPSDHPLEHNTAVKPGAESAESYKGTFVLSTPGSIKSITGRRFSLASGRLLASNQGGELAFHCDIADISLETDATVILDLSSRGILKIFALESTEHQGTIVETRVEGKIRTFKLTAGEEVLISDHNLSEADFVGSHLSLRNKIDDKFARGNFSVSQVLDKELLLRLRPLTITDEFTSAITQLKRRLAGGR